MKGIREHAHESTDWADEALGAVRHFDVELVRELLAAGLPADGLYLGVCDDPKDLVTAALCKFSEHMQNFANAEQLFAQRCAQVVEMLVKAGGPTWVNCWLGPWTQPVTDELQRRGIELHGLESGAELMHELNLSDDVGDRYFELINARAFDLFKDDAAAERWDDAEAAWMLAAGYLDDDGWVEMTAA